MGEMGTAQAMTAPATKIEAVSARETELDQNALVRACLEGDRGAAETLVGETYAMVYASLHRLSRGDTELAADLTQETYRKAWRALSSFDARARFSSWLYRIAYNTFLNHLRKPSRARFLEEVSLDGLRDPKPSPEEQLSEAETSRRLHEAVMGLPEASRFLVTARYWGEVPVSELAKMESVSTVAVRKRLRRALSEIRTYLEEGQK